MRRSLSAVVVTALGCGGAPAAPDAPPDAPECNALGTCVWLDEYQRRIVSELAGETEVAPGVRLLHRQSVAERDTSRTYLMAEFTALGYAPVRHGYPTGGNVVATLDSTTGGTGLIVVGAHFDSVAAGPGAADNATGVAIVLAAARYLRELPVRQHPIAFVLFDQEEIGLIGSKAYVQSLVAAQTQVTGAHVFDMLSFDGDGDRAVELWSPTAVLEASYQAHGGAAGTPIQPVTFKLSDHQAFLDAGFPAVGIGEEFVANDHTPHYHKATDTFAQVSFAHLATVTHLALAVLETDVSAP
jgi:hypothetical protein